MVERRPPTGLKRGRPPIERDAVTSEMLITGQATMAQLAQLFRTDAKTLPRRLHGLIPAGQRKGASVYDISEAAGRLVKPSYSIEAFIKKMHHSELPPMLGKEFWNAQNARQKFEENAADLWRTADVVEAFAAVFSTLRMTLLLVSDSVERETSLSDRQRDIVKNQIDGAIDEMKKTITELFKDYGKRPDLDGTEPFVAPVSTDRGLVDYDGPFAGEEDFPDREDHEEDEDGI